MDTCTTRCDNENVNDAPSQVDNNRAVRWDKAPSINYDAPVNEIILDEGLPLIFEGADEQMGRDSIRHIDRLEASRLLDWNLRRLTQSQAVIDMRAGELLEAMKIARYDKLGYVRLADYVREELGVAGRSATMLIRNQMALQSLPHLSDAHRSGKISKSKLRWLLRVVNADNEAEWIEKASAISVRALEDLVKAAEKKWKQKGVAFNGSGDGTAARNVPINTGDGTTAGGVSVDRGDGTSIREGVARVTDDLPQEGDNIGQVNDYSSQETAGEMPDSTAQGHSSRRVPVTENVDEDPSGFLMRLKTTPELASAWHFALEHFRRREGGNFSTAVFIEALLAEFCSALALGSRSDSGEAEPGEAKPGKAKPGEAEPGEAKPGKAKPGKAEPEECACSAEPAESVESVYSEQPVESTCSTKPSGSFKSAETVTSTPGGVVDSCRPLPHGAETLRLALSETGDEVVVVPDDRSAEFIEKWRELHKDIEEVTKMWEFLDWKAVSVVAPISWNVIPDDSWGIAEALKECIRLRQSVNFYMGRMLRTFENLHLHRDMEFLSFGHYVVERLGISRSTARTLIRLVRGFLEFPLLEKAYRSGRITQEKARLILRVMTGKTEKEWLRYGCEVPALNLELEVKRLDLLIKADSNLLDRCRVVPGFGSDREEKKENATSPEQMCASQSKDIEATLAEQMCANQCKDTNTTLHEQMCASQSRDTDVTLSEQMCASQCKDTNTTLPEQMCANHCRETDIILPEQMCASQHCPGNAASQEEKSDSREETHLIPEEKTPLNAVTPVERSITLSFFLPDDLVDLWNYAFRRYLEGLAGGGDADRHILLEGFIFTLVYHYLETEQKHLKRYRPSSHYRIYERDGYNCQMPGCSSRCNLNDHHITYRSHGGSDDLPNRTTACVAHHLHCLHDNGYITVEGEAPDKLIIAMGVRPGKPPFALFVNGRRVSAVTERQEPDT